MSIDKSKKTGQQEENNLDDELNFDYKLEDLPPVSDDEPDKKNPEGEDKPSDKKEEVKNAPQ